MRSEVHAQRLLVLLVIAAVVLACWLARPFWQALFFAAVFAAALNRWMERLSLALHGHRSVAAALLTLGVLLAVLLPLVGLGATLLKELLAGVAWLRQALESEGVEGLLHRLPGPLENLARQLAAALPDPQTELQRLAGAQGGKAAVALGGVVAATTSAVFRSALFLIALYFLLTDGGTLIRWIDARVPLRPGLFLELMGEFKRTSVSVLTATLATAGIQTVTAFVGYLIARAPNVLFLSFATFVVALVPALGAAFMVVAVGLLLLATGHVLAGVFAIVWGVVVVSLVDNVARPYLLKGGMALNGGAVFFALLGGLATFGGAGLVIGPLALTFLATSLDMYRREFGPAGHAWEPGPAAGEAPHAQAGGGRGSRPAAP